MPNKYTHLNQLVGQALQDEIFPGIEVFFARGDFVIVHEVFGKMEKSVDSPKLGKNSLFDLASLTKPLATAPAILHLQENGYLNVSAKVSSILPEFKRVATDAITISHLLTHTSGLPDWLPLFEPNFNKADGWIKLINSDLLYLAESESIYSCLGFILLGEVVRRLSNLSLSEYCRRFIFEPLGLANMTFRPDSNRRDIVPTAYCPHRRKYLRGIVHDENAFLFDEEGGNAGLFGNAEEIYQFFLMLMNGGERHGNRIFSPESIALMLENQNPGKIAPRTMGWDIKAGNDEYMSCGKLMPNGSVGHLGFTGTSVWFDKVSKYIVILLSNRVNITREDNIPKMREFRPKIHDLLLSLVR